jgi:hypothetical protein
MRFMRSRPSPALIVAALALVVALAGTAVAAPDLATKKVTKAKVKKIAKKQGKKQAKKQIRKKAPKLSVAHADTADQAAQATEADLADQADNALQLDGVGSDGYFKYGSTIPSGTTLTGSFGSIGAPATGGGGTAFQRESVSLPLKPPVVLTAADVNFSPGTFGGDDDPTCTGSAADPTAPAGKVCLYGQNSFSGTTANSGTGQGSAFTGTNSGFGFGVASQGSPFAGIVGNWAYTAP